ncbi:MAG: DUF6513 domain-containing protein [Planctomycetota bacterium]
MEQDEPSTNPPQLEANDHVHFVTGRLAETAVADQIDQLRQSMGIQATLGVMPITVAALMTPKWLSRKLAVPPAATHLVLPGYCRADLSTLVHALRQNGCDAQVHCGPNDCRDLVSWFTGRSRNVDLSQHRIEVIAEINHAPRLTIPEVVAIADQLRDDGADRIDVGADPNESCRQIGNYVAALTREGHRVSIDTFDHVEASMAVDAGATLWLSVHSRHRRHASTLGCEVVVIPDTPTDLDSLEDTVDYLDSHNVAMRLDPILEPIGTGLMASLIRYHEVRRRFPDRPMMMGIGNLTELTDVDSAGVNMVLLGICEELGIESVLTTQVINWARSSVRECDVARRMVHHAVANRVPPKRLSQELVMLRDPKLRPHSRAAIEALAAGIKDNNYRIIAQHGQIELISAGVHLVGEDPFELLDQLLSLPQSDNVDASHAFYLGYEMSKASTAIQLGKQYEQDQALQWGHLTRQEDLHRIARTSRHRKQS